MVFSKAANMARTMAGGQRKAMGAKAPRKTVGCSSSSSSSTPRVSSVASPARAGKSKSRATGGNTPTHWDTPKWQKGIACFFKKAEVEAKVTQNPANESDEEQEEMCSQESTHTLDLNPSRPSTPPVLTIFDNDDSPSDISKRSASSSCSDDGEQPGPSSRSY